ncbi:MAG: relaxase MobL, partial [Clostridiales bacterium]|nr:relaxase MobL [Clostridiales bacterium]
MAKLVMYSPYMKPNDKKHLSRYVSYIATRENVEFAENTEKYKPATPAQQKLVDELLGAYPDVRGSLEFADYSGSPTVGNAHELIDYALDNFVRTSGAEADAGAYVKYIAERPRVEKLSSHGLFSDAGKVINLAAACEETANCGSNVWTHIISLKREDAERLGYDAADSWVQLLRAHRDDIAGAMHIVPANFRWYAAFHNEKHHPHVHMVAYSVKPSEAWLNTDGIEKIKSVLANDIFRDEMDMVYQQKSARRQEVKRTSAFVFQRIMSSINTGTFNNPALENNIADLADKLKNVKGKKQYGYLPANVKKLVDDVADELAKDKRIDDLYDLWYGEKYKSVALYTDTMPDKEPLSQNREFKSIKNMIINEILDIGNLVKNCALPDVVNDEAADNSNMAADFGKLPDREFDAPLAAVNKKSYMGSCYKEAKELLKAETVTFDIGAAAADLFKESAELGSSVAAYQLGKLYLYGAGEFPADVDKGIEWLDKAAAGNNQWAEYLLGKIYLQGKLAQRDPARAEELLKRACAHDNKFAQYLLGNTYLKGEPLQQNVSAGIDLLQKAAKQGCTPANYRLGKLLYEGKEVKQDIYKAIAQRKQAAAKDN